MRTFLGIDGGGTRAALLNSMGQFIGYGEAGSSNDSNIARNKVLENLRHAAARAYDAARLPFQPADGCFMGVAGVKSTQDEERVRGIALEAQLGLADAIEVANDSACALAGGLAGVSPLPPRIPPPGRRRARRRCG